MEASEVEVEQAVPALRLQHLDVVVGDEYDGQPRTVHADLLREPLLRERIQVVLPADHPEAGAERVPMQRLAGAAWAACQPGTGHREMQVRVCRRLGGFEPDLRHSSDDFLILLELVRTTGPARPAGPGSDGPTRCWSAAGRACRPEVFCSAGAAAQPPWSRWRRRCGQPPAEPSIVASGSPQ